MKSAFLTFSFFLVCILANAQQWEIRWAGGSNYTFLAGLHHKEEPAIAPCPPSAGYCSVSLSSAYNLSHTFDSKWGGFSQLQLMYRLNEKWKLQYALGGQLQRYQRHVELEYISEGIMFPGIEGEEGSRWYESYYDPSIALPSDPETGNTRLWYLRHQAGVSYLLYPKLALTIDSWADVLLLAAQYQMKHAYISQKNGKELYGAYDKSGADFKHTVVGLEAGISYTLTPKLHINLSYSRSLTPLYKKTEFVSPGKAYANQLQLGLAYSLFAL